MTKGPVPQSVLSFSEESLPSGEDSMFSGSGSNNGSTAHESMANEKSFKGIAIPNLGEEFDFHEFDNRFSNVLNVWHRKWIRVCGKGSVPGFVYHMLPRLRFAEMR
jgi:hypothetical protein